ncbi:hypothetical protein KG031_10355, partial [Streptococcus pneumoniae]|nr:hypothetical protein [Streptococcus pneumoniae]
MGVFAILSPPFYKFEKINGTWYYFDGSGY